MLQTLAAQADELIASLGREHLGHSLQDRGWTLRFDGARRRLGLCIWMKRGRLAKIISLSRHAAVAGGWELMEDVVRHEAAHAIDFETRGRSGHDRTWKQWAIRCGADPTRLYEGEAFDDPAAPYLGRCPAEGCGYRRPFYRAVTAAHLCPQCERDPARTSSFLRVTERRSGETLYAGGSTPGRSLSAIDPKYVGRCPECGAVRPFARRPKRRHACVDCCRRRAGGRFDARFELVLVQRR